MSDEKTTVEEAIYQLGETKAAIQKADVFLEDAKKYPESVLSRMMAPTLKIKETLEEELLELQRIVDEG